MNFSLKFGSIYLLLLSVFTAVIGGGGYKKEEDEVLLPIVLAIVSMVAFACVIGCCIQGQVCCNNLADKNSPEMQGNTSLGRANFTHSSSISDRFRLEKENCGHVCRSSILPAYADTINEKPRLSSCGYSSCRQAAGKLVTKTTTQQIKCC